MPKSVQVLYFPIFAKLFKFIVHMFDPVTEKTMVNWSRQETEFKVLISYFIPSCNAQINTNNDMKVAL